MVKRLSVEQQILVEQHQMVSVWAVVQLLRKFPRLKPEREDLLQVGYLALCEAALAYDSRRAKFKTFAEVVVTNYLTNYCRDTISPPMLSLDAPLINDSNQNSTLYDVVPAHSSEQAFEDIEVQDLLDRCASTVRGVARSGVTALRLQYLGYSGADTAALFRVPTNWVSAWVSRARKQLKKQRAS